MTTTAPRPAYGLGSVVPDDAIAAWGTRLIVKQTGETDMLGDRMGSDQGPHSQELIDYLNDEVVFASLRVLISEMLRDRTMSTREGEDFILYMDDRVVVHANTNGSYGYCYVTAWLYP